MTHMNSRIKMLEFEKFLGANVRARFRPLFAAENSAIKSERITNILEQTLVGSLKLFYNLPKGCEQMVTEPLWLRGEMRSIVEDWKETKKQHL